MNTITNETFFAEYVAAIAHDSELLAKRTETDGNGSYTLIFPSGDIYEQIYTLKAGAVKRRNAFSGYSGDTYYYADDYEGVGKWNGKTII